MPEPTDLPEGFVCWIYPERSRCTACASKHWRPAGHQGRKRYRRCSSCGTGYPVPPIAMEIDQGGRFSVIKPL